MSLTGLSRAALLASAAAFCGLLCLPVRPALAATTYTVDSQADSPKMGGSGAACQSILSPAALRLSARAARHAWPG